MRKISILGAILILALSACLKEDKLQKISFNHSLDIVIPATFADTSGTKETITSEGFILDIQKALSSSKEFDSSKVMYASILSSASITMEDSALSSFKMATEELLFSLERDPYRSVVAAYYNQPIEGNFTDLDKIEIPPVSTLAFLNNYTDDKTKNDTVFLHSNITLVDTLLDSIVLHLTMEFEGTFGSNEHR